MKKNISIVKNETPAPPPPPQPLPDYADFDRFLKRLRSLDEGLTRMSDFAVMLEEAIDKPLTEAKLNEYYEHQKWLAKLNGNVLKEVERVAAEREFYNAEALFDRTDDGWRLKRDVISEQVAVLIGSFPNAGPHNPQTYTGMLTNEIAAADPCAISLEAACRAIRRTKKFVPTIAEVLEVLEQESSKIADLSEAVDLDNWKHWNEQIAEHLAELRAKAGLPPE